jgi:hypothetical protein
VGTGKRRAGERGNRDKTGGERGQTRLPEWHQCSKNSAHLEEPFGDWRVHLGDGRACAECGSGRLAEELDREAAHPVDPVVLRGRGVGGRGKEAGGGEGGRRG